MNAKILQLANIYGKTPEEMIEQLADQALKNGPPAGLGPRIMWLRGVTGLTRDDLAEITGLSSSSIGGYERGDQEPMASAIIRLARGLNCSTDFLLGLSDSRMA